MTPDTLVQHPDSPAGSTPHPLYERRADLLEQALAAIRERGYW